MPADLPPGATRCRHHDRNQPSPCPGTVTWGPPGPDGRILSTPCTACGREWVDTPRDLLGQPVHPEPAA